MCSQRIRISFRYVVVCVRMRTPSTHRTRQAAGTRYAGPCGIGASASTQKLALLPGAHLNYSQLRFSETAGGALPASDWQRIGSKSSRTSQMPDGRRADDDRLRSTRRAPEDGLTSQHRNKQGKRREALRMRILRIQTTQSA